MRSVTYHKVYVFDKGKLVAINWLRSFDAAQQWVNEYRMSNVSLTYKILMEVEQYET